MDYARSFIHGYINMYSKKNLVEAIHSLNLPEGTYVVVGGGALTARDIRDTSDIDIVCLPQVFELFRLSPEWILKIRPDGKPGLHKEHIELYLDVNSGNVQLEIQDLIRRAEMIDGIPFASLSDVRLFKQAYGREKDLHDIALIDQYIH